MKSDTQQFYYQSVWEYCIKNRTKVVKEQPAVTPCCSSWEMVVWSVVTTTTSVDLLALYANWSGSGVGARQNQLLERLSLTGVRETGR